MHSSKRKHSKGPLWCLKGLSISVRNLGDGWIEVSMKKKEKIVNVAWQEMPGKYEARSGDTVSKLGLFVKRENYGMVNSLPNQTHKEQRRKLASNSLK